MPVDNVAASSVATSAWANQVADSVNGVEADIYAAGQLALPWAAITGKPATFPPTVAAAVPAQTYGLAKQDGVSAAGARADHHHGTPPLPTPTQLAIPWTEITGKPATFAPSAHAASHAVGMADQMTAAQLGAPRIYVSPGTPAGGQKIYVGVATPSAPAEGDIWIVK